MRLVLFLSESCRQNRSKIPANTLNRQCCRHNPCFCHRHLNYAHPMFSIINRLTTTLDPFSYLCPLLRSVSTSSETILWNTPIHSEKAFTGRHALYLNSDRCPRFSLTHSTHNAPLFCLPIASIHAARPGMNTELCTRELDARKTLVS